MDHGRSWMGWDGVGCPPVGTWKKRPGRGQDSMDGTLLQDGTGQRYLARSTYRRRIHVPSSGHYRPGVPAGPAGRGHSLG